MKQGRDVWEVNMQVLKMLINIKNQSGYESYLQ